MDNASVIDEVMNVIIMSLMFVFCTDLIPFQCKV